jgi:serine/threonine protein kinase
MFSTPKRQNIILGLIALWLIAALVGYFYFPGPNMIEKMVSEVLISASKSTDELVEKNISALIDCIADYDICKQKIKTDDNPFDITYPEGAQNFQGILKFFIIVVDNRILKQKFIAIVDSDNLILKHTDSAFIGQSFIAVSHIESKETKQGAKYDIGRTTDKTRVIVFSEDMNYFGEKIGKVYLALYESGIDDLIGKFKLLMALIGLAPPSILTVIWIILFLSRIHAKGKAQQSATFAKGDKIGIYTVMETMKQTTNAELYLAKDNFGRLFVIKIPSRKISIDLQHTNIVGIKDFYQEKEILVMEYIRGQDLADIIKLAPKLPINQVIFIISKIANGLRYAHTKGSYDQDADTKGIIHRDIKPGNIMISYEGDVKISDFGIAKDEKDPLTTIHATGTIIGTLSYMSPEQASGKKVNHQTDIYSLGLIFYEMLAGEKVRKNLSNDANILNTIRYVAEEDVEPLKNLRPDIPDELNKVVMKCLKKDKQERYNTHSHDELWRDLKRLKKTLDIKYDVSDLEKFMRNTFKKEIKKIRF